MGIRVIVVVSMLFAAACSSSSGPAPFTLNLSSPAQFSLGADPSAPITIDLSRELDTGTVSATTVCLVDTETGAGIPVLITVVGARVTITPSAPLLPDRIYRVQLKQGIADTTGEFLPDDIRVVFSTAATGKTVGAARHPFNGAHPKLLTDVSYDVDDGRSYDMEWLADAIANAQTRADNANEEWGQRQNTVLVEPRFTKFHFWPNIIDLTEVYFRDATLFGTILDEFLANDPSVTAVRAALEAQAMAGERLCLGRDFVALVSCNFRRFHEVHYGFVINLDAQTVDEYRVHNELGLPKLHDPRIDDLQAIFDDPTSIGLGEAWCICLRGNTKRWKYQAKVVDKLDEAPNPPFYVRRVHRTCLPAESPPDIPPPDDEEKDDGGGGPGGAAGGAGGGGAGPGGPPKNPPPPEEKPEKDTPDKPANPDAPKPDKTADEHGVKPDPFPPSEDEDSDDEPDAPGRTAPAGDCPDEAGTEALQAELDACVDELETLRECFRQDVTLRNRLAFGWVPDAMFKNPSLQMTYDNRSDEGDAIQDEINAAEAEIVAANAEKKRLKLAASKAVQAAERRADIWDEIIHRGGPWQNIVVACQPPIIPAGGAPQPGADPLTLVTPQQQANFALILLGLMQRKGQSFDQAFDNALDDPSIYPDGVKFGDRIWQTIWKAYAVCLRDQLWPAMIKSYFSFYCPELTQEQLEQLCAIMLGAAGDDSLLTKAQIAERNQLQADLQAECDKAAAAVMTKNEKTAEQEAFLETLLAELDAIIDMLRIEFGVKLAEIMIIEDYLEWCKTQAPDCRFRAGTQFCAALNALQMRGGLEAGSLPPEFNQHVQSLLAGKGPVDAGG